MGKLRQPAKRDQEASPFGVVLQELCESLPALGAALVDGEGETVDYAGCLEPYDIKVAAAEWRIVLSRCEPFDHPMLKDIHEFVVRSRGASYAVYKLAEGYALVICLPGGSFRISPRALGQAMRGLCKEGGFEAPAGLPSECWLRVQIEEESKALRRPRSICFHGTWQSLEVLGRYHGEELLPREEAYMVRLENGLETMLVRERFGRWFSDHPISRED